ncbi:MAG: hypothetical protein ACR2JC_04355 [Chloroflexota bacterium]|nr:MAG: hypothetical protein DLM70_15530 [Chloroflexota bacterium]
MAFTQRQLDEVVSWVADAPSLALHRKFARRHYFGEDDPRPVEYWGGAGDPTSRRRRFLGYFLFAYRLPDGRNPAEAGIEELYRDSEREVPMRAVRGARYVMAAVRSVLPGRAVYLEVEKERFELRHHAWSSQIPAKSTIFAHLVPSRRGLWVLGPGWLEMPMRLGPGVRSNLSNLQPDPIFLERLLQGRIALDEEERPAPPQDATLREAASRMSAEARLKGKDELILSAEAWEALVWPYLMHADITSLSEEIMRRAGNETDIDELNMWMALANNIWNTTPQPDRGGKTANELVRERWN